MHPARLCPAAAFKRARRFSLRWAMAGNTGRILQKDIKALREVTEVRARAQHLPVWMKIPKQEKLTVDHNQNEQGDPTEVMVMCHQHQPERHVIAEKKNLL